MFDVSRLKDKGFILVKNFLTSNEASLLKSIVLNQCKKKGSKENYFSTNYTKIYLKLLKLNFKKFHNHLKIFSIIKAKNMNVLANNYFNLDSNIHTIDGYISKVTEGKILPWHTDKAYNGKSNINIPNELINPNSVLLKFFVYLSNVGPNDGCTSYLPYSQKVGKIIREGIFKRELDYCPYWSLKQFLNFINIKKNYEYIKKHLVNSITIDDFISELKEIKDNEISKYDFHANAGDAIIFDEGGIHRGSTPTLSDRIVLRFNFRASY